MYKEAGCYVKKSQHLFDGDAEKIQSYLQPLEGKHGTGMAFVITQVQFSTTEFLHDLR